MPEKLRQGHFSEITPRWPEQAEVLVDRASELVYQRCLTALHNLNIELPEVFTEKQQTLAPGITVSPSWFFYAPRICDLEVPEQFQRMLSAYARKSKEGRSSTLPHFGQISLALYEFFPVPATQALYSLNGEYSSFLGVEFADRHGLLEVSEEEYRRWFNDSWWHWHPNQGTFVGYNIAVERGDRVVEFEVSKEPNPRLFQMEVGRVHPLRQEAGIQAPLKTRASFRDGKLFELWQEEVNDTFFKDPRKISEIWPYWLTSTKYSAETRNNPPTQQNWEAYLAAVRAGNPVYYPGDPWDPPWERKGQVRQMTEREALSLLERWRRYIYYNSIQAFRFRRYQNANVFRAEIGYGAEGNWGDRFVRQKSEAYKRLSPEETVEALRRFSDGLSV